VIGRAGQSAAVDEHLTGRENLVMAVRLYHLGRVQSHHRAAELLTRFELSQAAERTVRWLERITAGRAEDLQLMYGVGGERLLPEVELDTLDGCAAPPVRIGQAAAGQFQLDVYGYLLDTAWLDHRHGGQITPTFRRLLTGAVEVVARRWTEPDEGTCSRNSGGQPPATCRTSSVATPSRKPASSPHRVISQDNRRPMGNSSPMTYSSAPAARARQPTNR
jgi:hypothetical protein